MLFKFSTKLLKYHPAMEAKFSLSRHSYTKPIFTPHLHGVHVDLASYRQPPYSPQSWPTPVIRSHHLTWVVDALSKPEGHGWGGGKPSKSCPGSQGESHYKEWAVNSLPGTRGANGGKDPRPWAAAFIAKTAVGACLAGAAIGMLGAMVAPPAAIASYAPEPDKVNDVAASTELEGFLQADLCSRRAKEAEIATTYVLDCLRNAAGSGIDYPRLKVNARVAVASGEAKEMMEMLEDKCFNESKEKEALELGLIYVEMLILQGKGDDALLFLKSFLFKKIVDPNGSKRDGRPYLYQAAAQLLLGDEEKAIWAWNRFASAENARRGEDGDKIQFKELKESMKNVKSRYNQTTWKKCKYIAKCYLSWPLK